MRFSYRDRTAGVDRVLLRHELRSRLPHELSRRPRTRLWELTAPRPDVDRFEYQFELIHRDGSSEYVTDPQNPLRASGPWGDKSVLELPGYEPPNWLDAEQCGDARAGRAPEPPAPYRATGPPLGPSRTPTSAARCSSRTTARSTRNTPRW